MTWFAVLLKHWSRLSAETQEKVREYYRLRALARRRGGRRVSEMVQRIEQELQAEARRLGQRS